MPVVSIQIVHREEEKIAATPPAQVLADELGKFFQSDRGGTWVRVTFLPFSQFAESERSPPGVRPVFVEVSRWLATEPDELTREAGALAEKIGRILKRPREDIHIIYPPPGDYRIAFGGQFPKATQTGDEEPEAEEKGET